MLNGDASRARAELASLMNDPARFDIDPFAIVRQSKAVREASRAAQLLQNRTGADWSRETRKAIDAAFAADANAPVSAHVLNAVCLSETLYGRATEAISYCDRAVAYDPDDIAVRDSRGIARAAAGNTRGAIEDFTLYAASNAPDGALRAQWITELRGGGTRSRHQLWPNCANRCSRHCHQRPHHQLVRKEAAYAIATSRHLALSFRDRRAGTSLEPDAFPSPENGDSSQGLGVIWRGRNELATISSLRELSLRRRGGPSSSV